MTQHSADPNPADENAAFPVRIEADATPSRCRRQFANGTRCRLLTAYPDSPFCPRHSVQPDTDSIDTDLSSAFGEEPTDFQSATQINHFLAKLSDLLVQNRISSRRASVLAYISSLELRTLPAIEHEVNPYDFRRIVFDSPEPESEPASENTPS
jgi:hypothetical protein